ncbi:DUF7283 family protein [Halopiger djelfimassiliensis]|uniref:DUF7283 family protein n=1 Tax=Halopiger djelfimassiliensis TaxID=1293047 RepID=UPI000677DBC2|nr:hypothetical protein [Halopiger djelfimassiliensis]
MDLEAPVDAWYVYLAVAIISVALAGLALGVSTGPPPDANEAANTIEGTTGSDYSASASYEHDADVVTINRETITMENDHGTSHASFSYGIAVPVNGHERLENLVYGSTFEEEYKKELSDPDTHAFQVFTEDVEEAFDDNTGEPLPANGELLSRQIVVDAGIDEIEPLSEEAKIKVTKTAYLPAEPRIRGENIREVTLKYDGVEDRSVRFYVEGDYAGWSTFDEEKEKTFEDGSGEITLEIKSSTAKQPAAEPVKFEVEFEEDGELPEETWESDDLEIGETHNWDNEIEREAEFDHDHSIIGLNDGGNYYVTLVIV